LRTFPPNTHRQKGIGGMSSPVSGGREGSLEAPTRHPLDWKNPSFYDEAALEKELTRVFDICHGCRRCFSLCNSFPTLFDAVDGSSTGELDGVDRKAYWEVVDHCYLCDMCFMTKCPYVPPHPWNVDFPHLMLRAKAVHARKHGMSLRNQVLASTDKVGAIAGIPVVVEVVNAVNQSAFGRKVLDKVLGVHPEAPIPKYHSNTARKRLKDLVGTTSDGAVPLAVAPPPQPADRAGVPNDLAVTKPVPEPAPSGGNALAAVIAKPAKETAAQKLARLEAAAAAMEGEGPTPEAAPAAVARETTAPKPAAPTRAVTGRVALFTTCYGNRNEPDLDIDLVKVFQHNGIEVRLVAKEQCCGMPKLELGDLEAVARAKDANIPHLMKVINNGYDIVAPIPSCVLMFKQELPLMFPNDADVKAVQSRIFDPFEYLMLRHRAGLLKTDFKQTLGKVSYHVPCHLRVQNIGLKTRDVLKLVPDTTVDVIERCSGHNGTYAVKKEFRSASVKIGRPVMTRVENAQPSYYTSDCPMAGHQIESGLKDAKPPTHPLTLLRIAYGL
jgi:Fe-S oxidoreductase